jgi:hypothetical protein
MFSFEGLRGVLLAYSQGVAIARRGEMRPLGAKQGRYMSRISQDRSPVAIGIKMADFFPHSPLPFLLKDLPPMSSWTLDPFDPAPAREWVADLMQSTDCTPVEEALELVVDTAEGYLEKADGERALASMELVAAAMLRPCGALAENPALGAWVRANMEMPDIALVRLARRASARLLGEDSELREFWEDSDDFDAWLADIYDLRERLMP